MGIGKTNWRYYFNDINFGDGRETELRFRGERRREVDDIGKDEVLKALAKMKIRKSAALSFL